MNICKKCKCEFKGNYCSNCGHPQVIERINGRYIVSEIGSVLNFQKGFFFTIKELLIRPGKNIKTFITEDRNRLVKPIMFILITSLIYSLVNSFFHLEDGFIDGASDALEDTKSVTLKILEWVQGHYGYANIIMAVFIGLWLKVFFRKNHYNFFEILILLCFVMGIGMLIYSIFGVIKGLTQSNVAEVGAMIAFIYTVYAIGQFFDKGKIESYLKSLVSYLLGMITFTFVAISVGLIFDLAK